MNPLDAMIRDIPRSCVCKWRWLKKDQVWVWWGAGPECPVHVPAVIR